MKKGQRERGVFVFTNKETELIQTVYHYYPPSVFPFTMQSTYFCLLTYSLVHSFHIQSILLFNSISHSVTVQAHHLHSLVMYLSGSHFQHYKSNPITV